jgi:arylsulfatase A
VTPATFALTLLVAGALPSSEGARAPAGSEGGRPNIIFVLADDLGLSRVSCYGADRFATPHIDGLAARGARFERAYSMPMCGPTRAVCLTGRYPFRTGQVNNAPPIDLEREAPLARVLQQAGYATCAIGKWGQLGLLKDREDARRWGFDEYMLWLGNGSGPGQGAERYWNPRYERNGVLVPAKEGDYGPDLTNAFLMDFMSRHQGQPFFVYYATPLVHWPFLRTPDSASGGGEPHRVRDGVAYLDKLVGTLVAELARLKLREKTIIVFTSDNGPDGNPLGTIRGKRMLGRKGSLKEGGCREPLIVSGSHLVRSGVVLPDLVDLSDLYPTFLELAGAAAPTGRVLDGRSFAPQLRGEKGAPREWVYAQLGEKYFIADSRYKLYSDGTFVDISDSPVAEPPAVGPEAAAAKARLQAALDTLRAGVPSVSAKR